MIKETIYIDLSNPDSIKRAIADIQYHKTVLKAHCNALSRAIAEEVEREATLNYSLALGDYVEPFDRKNPYITRTHGSYVTKNPVTVSHRILRGTKTISKVRVKAKSKDVAFIEFGSGVFHNGSAGSSPHPVGAEKGMTIASYGKGLGRNDWWVFTDGGTPYKSYGTPASGALYRAGVSVGQRVASIVQEVFK